ncbi:MAG: DUF2306 domain-containing protein [Propionibacteriales bacterium]|nr:DUF2306 domain-containing protein [Propionibacteriales bacterium]
MEKLSELRPAGVRVLPVAGGVAALLALLYTPIAFTSMFFTVDADAPRLQVRLDALVAGEADVTGPGSVAAARTDDYRDQRVAMLVHTTTGSAALLLAAGQSIAASRGLRRGHRAVGRAYLAAVIISMGAAVVFLLRAPPVEHVGQVALSWQLWVLGLSTLGATLAGVLAARAGQVLAHRCWMTLALCFLLTAPALRLLWAALGPLLPDHDQLTRLDAGAVALAVLAPGAALLAGASVLNLTVPGRPRALGKPEFIAASVSLGGIVAVLLTRPDDVLTASGTPAVPPLYAWFHAGPALILLIVVLGLARRSAPAWRPVVVGVALAPLAAVASGRLLLSPVLGDVEGWLAGLMVAPGFPIVTALAVLLLRHGHRTPAPSIPSPVGRPTRSTSS